MKAHRLIQAAVFCAGASLAYVAGCKYNVTEPLWYQPYAAPASPVITSVNPASEARPGVSTITLHGHNLVLHAADASVSSGSVVLFSGSPASVVSMDTNLIVVRRPNLVSDSCTIRVVPHNALAEAAYGPYKIDPVILKYGGFLQNVQLGAIAVDNAENLYVIETINKLVHKAISSGDNTVMGGGSAKTALSPYCARIGPDGNLYVMENNRSIDRVDLTTGAVARWTQLPSGKVVKFGDFGPGGYLYTGGPKTDLCVVPPNPPVSLASSQIKLAGSFIGDEILAIRVYNNSVYVASRPYGSVTPAKIWGTPIVADSVGPRQLVLDLGATAYGADLVTDFAFSSAGVMFIATSSVNDPVLIVDPVTFAVDNFYMGIVPPYCVAFSWSQSSNYLYLISGNTAAAQTWTVYRLDMGATGAP